MTVLLVEDDLEIRDILQDSLEKDGYEVIPASHGQQAIDFLSMNQPARADLVILDLMMPLVSGWEVLDHIKADSRLADIPVIVLSAVTRDKPTGVHTFISKPFSLDHLFDVVRGCLPPRPAQRSETAESA